MEDETQGMDYAARSQLGQELAASEDVEAHSVMLGRLLLDPLDTMVTLVTAEALLARDDDQGLMLVLRAASTADDNTLDWLQAAVENHAVDHGQPFLDRLTGLTTHQDSTIAQGALLLRRPGRAPVRPLIP